MPTYDDEIDLRPYIQTILQHWWQIVLVGVLLGAVGLLFSLSQPHFYQSSATILLTRSRSRLALSDQYQTVTEPYDSRSRLDALMAIVQSDDVSSKVIKSLGSQITAEGYDITKLKEEVDIQNKGDALVISASDKNPARAAEIANAWAKISVATINQAYSDDQPLADLQGQITTARSSYDNAQAAYESFVKTNRIGLLNNQITEAQTLETSLSNEKAWKINYYTQRIQDMEDLEVKSAALKSQMESGNRSNAGNFGDALSVLLARAAMINITPSTDLQPTDSKTQPLTAVPVSPASSLTLNLQISDTASIQDSASNYAADLDSIIKLAQTEGAKAQDALNSLTQAVVQGTRDDQLELAAARVSDLQTQLEDQNSKEQELRSQRDLSWEAYQAMVQKEAEVKNAAQSGTQVNLASSAIPPQEPMSRGTARNTIAGFGLGVILSSLSILALEWWRSAQHVGRESLSPVAGKAVP